MARLLKWLMQGASYAAFIAVIGFLSTSPAYEYVDPTRAVIRMAFSHAAERKEKCRRLSPAEMQRQAPNMRHRNQCGRERLPVEIEPYMDHELLIHKTVRPSGIWDDGPSTVYERFVVAPGSHLLTARLRDSHRTQGFDFERSERIQLNAQQNFVISFRPELGGFGFD